MKSEKYSVFFVNTIIYFLIQIIICEGGIYTDNGGPANWKNSHPECGGKKQSPINLPSVCKAVRNKNYTNFQRNSVFYKFPEYAKVTLNDHGVEVRPIYANNEKATITGGPLYQDTYILEQFHFHWGSNNSIGSEHSIDNKFYALEAHAVHYNSKYGNFENASTKPDGLAVIAYLYYPVRISFNIPWNVLAGKFLYMINKNSENVDTLFPPISMMLPPFQSKYLTYSGSLTTPPCSESVTWIVSANILRIPEIALMSLRAFYGENHGLINNFRPIQPLNGRVVSTRMNDIDYYEMKC